VDRVRVSDTTWRTTVTVLDAVPEATALHAAWRPARWEIDESGHRTVWRTDGSTIPWPAAGQLPGIAAMRGRVKSPAVSKELSVAAAGAAAAAGREQGVASTRWADELIRSAADCALEAQAAVKSSSFDHTDPEGNTHYTRQSGASRTEITVNPRRQLVVGTSITTGDVTLTGASDYASVTNGIAVRRSLRIEQTKQSGTPAQVATTISVLHVRIDGQEVIP